MSARENDGHYVLSGTKALVSNAPACDFAITYAKTSDTPKGYYGHSTFIVNIDEASVTIGNRENLMGLQSLEVADVHFNDTKLGAAALLGNRDEGIGVILKIMELMRIANSAVALGVAERAYDEALQYSKMRKINSTLMCDMPSVQFSIAEMKSKIEIMRLATFYAAHLIDLGDQKLSLHSSIVKYHVTEKANEICNTALQLFGGNGYVKGNTIERLYRDVRATMIIGGTTELLMSAIFKLFL